MKTGVYKGFSFEEYQAIRAANKSGLDQIKKSPLHYYSEFLDPAREMSEPTVSMILGSAIHTAVLEPEEFGRLYRKKPEPSDHPEALVSADDYRDACKKEGISPLPKTKADMKAALVANKTGYEFFEDIEAEILREFRVLSAEGLRACAGIAANVRKHASASELLANGSSEVTVVWNDEETGVLCKGRIDRLSEDCKFIIDLKSATDASRDEFARSVAKYGYHRQAAWYLDGLEKATGIRPEIFTFIVYETSAPYASAFYYADERMIAQGREENRRLLRIYAECLNSNRWPGYPEELQPLSLPAWYLKPASEQKPITEVY